MVERLHCHFMSLSSARLVIPGTEVEIRPVWEELCCHGGEGKWMIFCLCWRSGGKRVESSSAFRRKLERLWRRCEMSTSRAIRFGWSSVLHCAQEVWAVALIIRMLDASEVVSLFRCALKVKLLFKITPRRRRVVLTWVFWLSIKIVGFQELLLDQVEKRHTSLFSAF